MTEAAVIPAFETADVQEARRTARQVRLSYEPAEQFIARLKDMQSRSKDFIVPFGNLSTEVLTHPGKEYITDDGVGTSPDSYKFVLRLTDVPLDGKKVPMHMGMYDHVLGHLSTLTGINDRTGVPIQYLRRLLDNGFDRAFVNLASANVNEFLSRRRGEAHTRGKKGEQKAVFVRAFRGDDGQYKCRALLSDRYFPIRTLDMVTIALACATGKLGNANEGDTAIKNAFMFDQRISVTGCTVGFVNPNFAFDLKHPDKGIIKAEKVTQGEGGQPVFHYPGGASYALGGRLEQGGGDQHLVFPACRMSNSETGGGSAEVQPMIFEGACTNGMVFARSMKRTHVSSIMSEADEYESDATKKKAMEWIISKMSDAMQQVFDLKSFEANCRKFLKLAETELKSDKVKEVFENLLTAIPGGDGLLDDVLKAYERMIPNKDTMLDVQRALTSVAQDQKFDKQVALEEFAGEMVNGEHQAKKELLVTATR